MNETEPTNTDIVLPIICPKCSHEIELSIAFALLPPKEETIISDEKPIEA